jgi:NADPH-dependent 2,4-dienoyl-CoA reductase/sulfur reductase-like enzyme
MSTEEEEEGRLEPVQMNTDEEDLPIQSAAMEWQKKLQENGIEPRRKFLVIGGGWGGWGAAKALCESGVDADITLLDALPDPTGVSLWISIYIESQYVLMPRQWWNARLTHSLSFSLAGNTLSVKNRKTCGSWDTRLLDGLS